MRGKLWHTHGERVLWDLSRLKFNSPGQFLRAGLLENAFNDGSIFHRTIKLAKAALVFSLQ